MSRGRWNGFKVPVTYCSTSGKVKYDKRGAQTAANSRYAEDHIKLRTYACGFCNTWHLTKAPFRRWG